MTCSSGVHLIYYAFGAVALYVGWKFLETIFQQRKYDRWSNTSKDVVIVHGIPAGYTIPNASPFMLKLLTFLRMTKIRYEIDTKDGFGPKGKLPWISLNGTHMGDSQLIVQYLSKKFDKNCNANYSEDELAVATAVRIVLEEHVFWGLALERVRYGKDNITKVMKVPLFFIFKYFYSYYIGSMTRAQGLGRHTQAEVEKMITKDLYAIKSLLGAKRFICGDEPCEEDCAIFGMLAQIAWGLPNSPYEKLMNGELKSLKDYCIRMKQRFWPDWDKCLLKK